MTARTLTPIEWHKFAEKEIERPAPMLGAWLSPGALVMSHAGAGAGKTFLNLGVSVALSCGVSVLGWDVPAPRPVLYVDGEMPAWMMQQRIKALREPIEDLMQQAPQPLHIITPDLQTDGIPKLDTDEGQLALLRVAFDIPDLALVVLDNLSCLTNPEDENASSSWSKVQELLLCFRRIGIAVIVTHHSGKGGQQRGTSRRADILDVILKLTPEAGGRADGKTRVLVEFEKGRSLTSEQQEPFTATLEPAPHTGLIWTRSGAQLPKEDRIRQMLLDGMPAGDVAAELGTARSYVYRIKTSLEESGDLAPGRKRGDKTKPAPMLSPGPPPLGGDRGQTPSRGQGTNAGTNRGHRGQESVVYGSHRE